MFLRSVDPTLCRCIHLFSWNESQCWSKFCKQKIVASFHAYCSAQEKFLYDAQVIDKQSSSICKLMVHKRLKCEELGISKKISSCHDICHQVKPIRNAESPSKSKKNTFICCWMLCLNRMVLIADHSQQRPSLS